MRTLAVVFYAPGRNLAAGVKQIPEPAHIQTFIPQPAMEAFHVRILCRLARLDVNRVNASLDAPGQVVSRAELRPIVAPNRHRYTACLDDLCQSARDATARQGGGPFQR